MLTLTQDVWLQIVGHAFDGLPEEACGLLASTVVDGLATGHVQVFYPCVNQDASSRVFTIGPWDWMRAERDADDRGLALVGTMHSHTHTEAYPSPTDIEAAKAYEAVPGWHHVIVSLRRETPVLRSYQITAGHVEEEPVALGSPQAPRAADAG